MENLFVLLYLLHSFLQTIESKLLKVINNQFEAVNFGISFHSLRDAQVFVLGNLFDKRFDLLFYKFINEVQLFLSSLHPNFEIIVLGLLDV